jgi:hypothetical protein
MTAGRLIKRQGPYRALRGRLGWNRGYVVMAANIARSHSDAALLYDSHNVEVFTGG